MKKHQHQKRILSIAALALALALLLPALIGTWGVYLAEIAAWIGAGLFLIIGCYRRLRTVQQHVPVS